MTVRPATGEPYVFEVVEGITSRLVCEEILAGRTYPVLPFIGDVRLVVDAGANCGAATVYFAQQYPGAVVHAVEPAAKPLEHLRRNVRGLPNVIVHPIGLHSQDDEVPLYHGRGDTGLGSIFKASWHQDSSEMISLRSAAAWAEQQGIEQIDVLKVDVELSEYEVLSSLAAFLPSVKVIYLEYGSRQIRRDIERLLDPTHDLYLGKMSLDQGEVVYVRRDLAERAGARERLWSIVVERAEAHRPVARARRQARGAEDRISPDRRSLDDAVVDEEAVHHVADAEGEGGREVLVIAAHDRTVDHRVADRQVRANQVVQRQAPDVRVLLSELTAEDLLGQRRGRRDEPALVEEPCCGDAPERVELLGRDGHWFHNDHPTTCGAEAVHHRLGALVDECALAIGMIAEIAGRTVDHGSAVERIADRAVDEDHDVGIDRAGGGRRRGPATGSTRTADVVPDARVHGHPVRHTTWCGGDLDNIGTRTSVWLSPTRGRSVRPDGTRTPRSRSLRTRRGRAGRWAWSEAVTAVDVLAQP